ncbi:MAG: hypothetical protein HQ567_27410 [Candidatus Nealsonbacteria bacterium]|nr:hypothetical protein [Candidatus Nealsonbacteria bacterium]
MKFVRVACLIVPIGLLIAAAAVEEPVAKPVVKLPDPPARIAKSAEQAKECIECHEEVAGLLEGDKHIADDFHCTVCHGPSKPHVEMDEIGTLPDRVWRRWIEEENGFEWRVKHASLEIAKFCASCHGQKPPKEKKTPTIDWNKYLDTKHGRAVVKDNRDAPTCTDCHYAHGAGSEPMSNKTIVRRCAVCHADAKMMKRAGLDPNVVKDFKADTHGKMKEATAAEKSSCVKCHPPH